MVYIIPTIITGIPIADLLKKNCTCNNHWKSSSQNQCPPGNVRTISEEVLKTYVQKHDIKYAYFCVRPNQICIILSTEVPPYPRTSPGVNFIPVVCQVFSLGNNCIGGLFREISPRTTSQGKKFAPTKNFPRYYQYYQSHG